MPFTSPHASFVKIVRLSTVSWELWEILFVKGYLTLQH